jgi:hypothetical protein
MFPFIKWIWKIQARDFVELRTVEIDCIGHGKPELQL